MYITKTVCKSGLVEGVRVGDLTSFLLNYDWQFRTINWLDKDESIKNIYIDFVVGAVTVCKKIYVQKCFQMIKYRAEKITQYFS